MAKQASVFVTVDCFIPRVSPSGSGWEVALIQRGNPPNQGMWALPGGHVERGDVSLEAAAQREAYEETGIHIPLHMLQPVRWYQDFGDERGKYICLLYTLAELLPPEVQTKAGDDATQAQWYSIEDVQHLPPLAFNHSTMIRDALRQFFIALHHDVLGLQDIDACQCVRESSPGGRCTRTAYWRYRGAAICIHDLPSVVARSEKE